MSTLMEYVLWVLVVGGLVGVSSFFYFNVKNYKKTIICKKVLNDNKVLVTTKAREYKDKDGVFWWKAKKKLFALGKIIPMPPDGAIELSNKGKEFVTCYIGETKQPVWQIDKTQDINKYIIEPFTTKQRVIYRQGLKDAFAKKKTGWMEQLPQILAVSAFVVIIAIMVFGYGEFAKPILEAEGARTEQLRLTESISNNQFQINQDIQVIKSEMGIKPEPEGGT